MSIELPPLPYAENALEPYISTRTVQFHYGKHHQGYVNKLNAAMKDQGIEAGLEEIMRTGSGSVFNNAAQIWNHTFYWSSLSPDAKSSPEGALRTAIDAAFGSVDGFKKEFSAAAAGQFGSGWAWLVKTDNGLEVLATKDAENPLSDGKVPLLTIDVWEHAYYLDHQNDRAAYIDGVLNNLLNWNFAEACFES